MTVTLISLLVFLSVSGPAQADFLPSTAKLIDQVLGAGSAAQARQGKKTSASDLPTKKF